MNTEFKAKIDTEEVYTSYKNVYDIEEIDEERYNYVKFKRITKNEDVVFVLHLSRFKARYDRNNYSFKEQTEAKEAMLKQLGIQCTGEVSLNRLDVCFDSLLTYKEMYKVNDCLMGLYRLNYKENDSVERISKKMRKSTSMSCSPRHQQLYIYDKKHESNGAHPFNTRIEFRFKDLKSNEEQKLKDLKALLDRLIENFETYEYKRAEELHEWYERDLEEGKIKNFSEFVRHNNDYVTTYKTLELLYEKMGMNGTCRSWLNKFRKTNEIEFTTKKEMLAMITDMKKALKEYVKN